MGELYVDGEWTPAAGGRREVVNPYDASVVTSVDEADAADVDRAVRAARRAFAEEDWPTLPPVAAPTFCCASGTCCCGTGRASPAPRPSTPGRR